MCGPKQPNCYTKVLMLIISVLTQHYHITYRPGMACLYFIKWQIFTKFTYQHEVVLTVPSTPANSLRLLLHTCQTPPQFLAGALIASDIHPASVSFGWRLLEFYFMYFKFKIVCKIKQCFLVTVGNNISQYWGWTHKLSLDKNVSYKKNGGGL